jgi:hypothetical protein
MDDRLEDIMMRRPIPKPSSNLAERIILASEMHRQQGKRGLNLWAHSFWDSFMLPQPAFVMAVVLLAGVFVGFRIDVSNASEIRDLSSYAYTGDESGEKVWP